MRAAVVGDGWLPAAVTRMTVDFADKNVVKFTGVVGTPGVSPLTSQGTVVSFGRLFGHRALEVGEGCRNVG